MADRDTLDWYDAHAAAYAERPLRPAHHDTIGRFMAALPPGGSVLDLGCGAGWASSILAERGFQVEAVDGSEGMVAEARRRTGLPVTLMRFEELSAEGAYDGVFASFSLLHAPRADAPDLLARVRRSLRPGGVLFLGVKIRDGASTERRDPLGRFYTDYSKDDILALVEGAGFTPFWTGAGVGVGADETEARHLYLLARAAEDGAPADDA